LDPIKGIETLINAFNRISASFPGIKLAIMGRGVLETQLRENSRGNGNINFLGHISDAGEKISIYRNSICLVLPSFYEASPMVIIESMAAGKPVIASNVGGVSELIDEGLNGFMVKPGDQLELSKAMEKMLSNPDIASKISKENLRKAEEKFGYGEMAKQVRSAYDYTLDKGKFK
jgi:glycosyltransferase involved in cell wall biosynthesis